VLDEPLSMLDTTAAHDLVHHLAELAGHGSAIVVCEHRAHYLSAAAASTTALSTTRAFREHRLDGHARPDTLRAPGDATPAPLSSAPSFHLALDGVSVTLGQRAVLEEIGLTLASGQVVALVGVNGSGKTTLLRSLVGLQPHAGKIEVTGGGAPDLGLVYQNPDLQLFNPTVREEVMYRVAAPNTALYGWLMTRLGLERYEASSPLLLSEGEKKRLCLAMVLMHQPRHGVLLDEPTLGQDDGHRALLGRAAAGLAEAGRLVVVATHDLAWAAHFCTHMLVLHQGRVIAGGPPRTLLSDAGLWQRVGLIVPGWIWEPIG
jgi:energy-coupling factor transporter ATP-binding protein EcfA2